jgi:hypothetical protein
MRHKNPGKGKKVKIEGKFSGFGAFYVRCVQLGREETWHDTHRGDVDYASRVAMVPAFETDDIVLIGVIMAQAECKVVGFRTRVDEKTDIEAVWEGCAQLLSVLDELQTAAISSILSRRTCRRSCNTATFVFVESLGHGYLRVDISCVGVQLSDLVCGCSHHERMAMPNAGRVVHTIEECLPAMVE